MSLWQLATIGSNTHTLNQPSEMKRKNKLIGKWHYYAIQCYTVLYSATQCYTVLYSAIQYWDEKL